MLRRIISAHPAARWAEKGDPRVTRVGRLLRQLVKPGIAGWAQVMYPYGSSVEDARKKLQFDLFYFKNCSLVLDLVIAVKTVRVILTCRGT